MEADTPVTVVSEEDLSPQAVSPTVQQPTEIEREVRIPITPVDENTTPSFNEGRLPSSKSLSEIVQSSKTRQSERQAVPPLAITTTPATVAVNILPAAGTVTPAESTLSTQTPQSSKPLLSEGSNEADASEKNLSSEEFSELSITPREGEGEEGAAKKKLSFRQRLQAYIAKKRQFVWEYLFLVGIMLGIFSFAHDQAANYLALGRTTLVALFPNSWTAQFLIWIIYNLLLVSCGMLLTLFFAPAAEGSGIPPVKAIINGAPLEDPISLPTLIIKMICLPLTIGAGMFMGKVDAHFGAAIANALMRVPVFGKIRDNPSLRLQMIACGAGAGVGANFGTPTGGMLFALEVFGTYYSLRSYQKSFFVALIGALTQRILHAATIPSLTVTTMWKVDISTNYSMPELIAAALLGGIMGILGSLFVYLNKNIALARTTIGKRKFLFFKTTKFSKSKFFTMFENQYLFTIFMVLITSVLTFPKLIGNFMGLGAGKLIEDLFRGDSLMSPEAHAADWGSKTQPYMLFVNLVILAVVRYVLTLFSVSLPIPGGMYVPLLIAGAAIGRLYGEVLSLLFPNSFGPTSQSVLAGGYAKIGAAALTAGATHAFSTCFILLEILGIYFHLPTLLAALVSIRIARKFQPSVYDTVIAMKKWPALVEANTDKITLPVQKAMQPADYLTQVVSIHRLITYVEALKATPDLKTHPVVKNNHRKMFIGTISTETLNELAKQYAEFDKRINIELPVTSHSLNFDKQTPLLHAHIVFGMLPLDRTFVLERGVLVGSLTRPDLSMIQKKKKNIYQKVTNRLRQRLSSKIFRQNSDLAKVRGRNTLPSNAEMIATRM